MKRLAINAECVSCKRPIELGRVAIGLDLCLVCGDRAAQRELAIKRSQTGPAYNKGAMQFLGGASFKQNMLDAGRKTSAERNDVATQAAPRPTRRTFGVRKRIGIMWDHNGDCFAIFDTNDPRLKEASRFVIW